MEARYVEIGKILRPQGNKGEVRVLSEANTPQAFLSLLKKRVFLAQPPTYKPRPIEVEDSWLHKGFVIVKLKGFDDIATAITIRNAILLIEESERDILPDGEYYLDQLIGLSVRDEAAHRQIGIVRDVIKIAGNDLLEVASEDGKKILVPFVEPMIHAIDLENKIIDVSLPEGLDEL